MKTCYQIKRNKYFSLLLLIPVVLAALAEYYAILSSYANGTYAMSSLNSIAVMTEVAMGLIAAVFLLGFFLKGRICMYVMDAVKVVAVVLLSLCFYFVLEERATLMGYVWFSDLESGNANSVYALNCGVASAVIYAVAILATAATGWLESVSAKKVPRTRETVQAEIDRLQQELNSLGNA